MPRRKRQRATAVVIRRGRVLLVRDRKARQFSLPGGGVHANEPTLSAAVRELFEETDLVAHRAKWLCDFDGRDQRHVAYRIEARGRVKIKEELAETKWWDRRENLPMFDHVRRILAKGGLSCH